MPEQKNAKVEFVSLCLMVNEILALTNQTFVVFLN